MKPVALFLIGCFLMACLMFVAVFLFQQQNTVWGPAQDRMEREAKKEWENNMAWTPDGEMHLEDAKRIYPTNYLKLEVARRKGLTR
jgi:hypothetical protein